MLYRKSKCTFYFHILTTMHGQNHIRIAHFMFDIFSFLFRKSAEKIQVSWKSDKTKGYFTWRPIYFSIIFRSLLLRIKRFQSKVVEKFGNTHFVVNVFRKSCRLRDNVEKIIVERGISLTPLKGFCAECVYCGTTLKHEGLCGMCVLWYNTETRGIVRNVCTVVQHWNTRDCAECVDCDTTLKHKGLCGICVLWYNTETRGNVRNVCTVIRHWNTFSLTHFYKTLKHYCDVTS